MNYKYSYNDWQTGKMVWNDIISYDTDPNYISETCIEKIQKQQRQIFKRITQDLLRSLIDEVSLKKRLVVDKSAVIEKYLKTK